ncbi:MAG: serine/threonine protein kinase [Planctomycetes bacterium]|nr:serine/threonine protein kinase [Planctomycetota bacterium]
MTPEEMQRIKEVFDQALHVSQAERASFLTKACEGDAALLSEVESLLRHHDEIDGFMSTSALGVEIESNWAAGAGGVAGSGSVSGRIGRYSIRRLIASGGMGSVYEAVQEHPHRVVALKVMRQGITSRSAMRRFEYEAQILARLRHPGICQIYEAGVHIDPHANADTAQRDEDVGGGAGGVPFFAMEYIPNARPITEYATQRKLSLQQRLTLFLEVCESAHHGHQKGIIHRDLKPGNILVDSSGQPKIIDFGVAKATDSDMAVTTLQTNVGQLIGTLQYMSPEQCEADPHDLDIRSDVYALGVVLYELLCDQPPYNLARVPIYEAARVIREQDPTRPSIVVRQLRGDLETIALKALAKDREDRYQSAFELARDIRRYMNDEPIDARPPSVLYQVQKFAYRNRLALGALSIVFAALVLATLVSLRFAVEKNRLAAQALKQQEIARDQAAKAKAVVSFLTDDLLGGADPAYQPDRDVTMTEVLERTAATIGEKFAKQPLTRAAVQMAVGTIYRRLGLLNQAETHLSDAIDTLVEEHGREHLDTVAARIELSSVYRDSGDIFLAGDLLLEALEDLHNSGADAPREEFDLRLRLALIRRHVGQLEEALRLSQEASALALSRFPKREGLLLRASESEATIKHDLGRTEEAVETLQHVLKRRQETEVGDSNTLLTAMYRVAAVLTDMEKYEEALELAQQTYDGRLRVFQSPSHMRVLNAQLLIARIHSRTGHLDQARLEYEQAVETMMGSDEIVANHYELLQCLWELSDLYLTLELEDEAEGALTRAIALTSITSTSERWHKFVAGLCRMEYGEFLLEVGRYAEADRELSESINSLSLLQAQYGEDNLYVSKARRLYLSLQDEWGVVMMMMVTGKWGG